MTECSSHWVDGTGDVPAHLQAATDPTADGQLEVQTPELVAKATSALSGEAALFAHDPTTVAIATQRRDPAIDGGAPLADASADGPAEEAGAEAGSEAPASPSATGWVDRLFVTWDAPSGAGTFSLAKLRASAAICRPDEQLDRDGVCLALDGSRTAPRSFLVNGTLTASSDGWAQTVTLAIDEGSGLAGNVTLRWTAAHDVPEQPGEGGHCESY
jgi:hypothetical protein